MASDDLFQLVRQRDTAGFLEAIKAADVNQVNEYGQTLLHEAIAHGADEIALHLVENGILVNVQDRNGQTPLHFAAAHGRNHVAREILRKRADLTLADKYGNQPLWTAVSNARGKYELVEMFLQQRADPFQKNKAGKSPWDFANQIGDEDLIARMRVPP